MACIFSPYTESEIVDFIQFFFIFMFIFCLLVVYWKLLGVPQFLPFMRGLDNETLEGTCQL